MGAGEHFETTQISYMNRDQDVILKREDLLNNTGL